MGGILGGAALTVILISSHFTLIMLPNLEIYEIPMAIIMKNLAPFFYWIFVMVIYGEIFTSVIGNVFGIDRQLKQYVPMSTIVTRSSAIFIVSYTALVLLIMENFCPIYIHCLAYISISFLFFYG